MSRRRRIKQKIRENITKKIKLPNSIGISNAKSKAKDFAETAKDSIVSGIRKIINANEEEFKKIYGNDEDDIIGSAWEKVKSIENKELLNSDNNSDNIEKLIQHIKDKKYTKTDIKNPFNKIIVIPYSNIDDEDFDIYNIKNDLFDSLNASYNNYIEIEEDGITNYYIPKKIKKYQRYAIVINGKNKDIKKLKSELEKTEKKIRKEANKNEAKELIKSIGIDILRDDKIDTFPPFSKIANSYCYIYPFNVILYEKNIIYGLKWEKIYDNDIKNSNYIDIKNTIGEEEFNIFKEKFKKEYDESNNNDVIELTKYKDVKDIVYDAKYLNDFKKENIYYKFDENNIYLCKNSKLNYKYKNKDWDIAEYFNDNSIDKLGLESNLKSIIKLNNDLTSRLEKLREKAIENGELKKYKELDRQDRSDERFNDNAGKVGYYTTLLFVHTAKYIQDTLLAGIKTFFIASWNNVITGFLILLFIILVIIMVVALGGGGGGGGNDGPNKKPKEENKDFISLLKSMPSNINSAFANFNNFATEFSNMITNGRRAVNDFTDAITGDNIPIDSIREAYDKNDGRGGDNIIHYNDSNDSNVVISAYKPYAMIVPDNENIVNKPSNNNIPPISFNIKSVDSGEGSKLYKLDCENTSNYFTKSCKLRKDYTLDTRFIEEPESDYEQIKLRLN